MRRAALALAALLTLCPGPALAGDDEAAAAATAPPPVAAPLAVVTTHEVEIGGQRVRYAAEAGWTILKNDEGVPKVRFGYTAYLRDPSADPAKRPVLFAFNGGPGSSSIWLHLGILGPRRVVVADEAFTPPPPVQLVDNAFSPLDVTDIVMIDPVGTGYSKTLGEEKLEDHWGVDQDIRSVADFVVQWVTTHERWLSPKFVLGESYGGIRAPGLVQHLQATRGMNVNGVILVSPFMDFSLGADGTGVDLPHALYLPAFAATAWYHRRLAERPADLPAFLAEVETFAMREYLPALLAGDALPAAERDAVAAQLARYTGTDKVYWLRAGLRVTHGQFLQELSRDDGLVTGRIDARFVGPSIDRLAESQDYDPFFPAVGPAFTAAFRDYYRRELDVEVDDTYVPSAQAWKTWDWAHKPPGAPGDWDMPFPNVLPDLAYAMKTNPGLHVLVQQGLYDLATPYFTTLYYLRHLDVPAEARERIRLETYEAGHMMYVHPASMRAWREHVVGFIRDTDRLP